MTDAVASAAQRLREAQAARIPCSPVRDVLGATDVALACSVQQLNTEIAVADGRRVIGWKIGLTNPAVQHQLGVDQPDFGALFADTEVFDDLETSAQSLISPRVEAEVAFVLEADLDMTPVSALDVVRATAFVLPAIEIVDSRIESWDITIVDTVADNASAGGYVLGAKPTPLTSVDLRTVAMEMTGPGGVVSEGSGSNCLGHPVNAVAWLAATLQELGSPLRAGDLVLSGALGPMATVQPGACYEATISGLGSVRARFEPE